MITVICTQCRAQLEMDDAFAGGVCRCQFCGTIQTVPSMSKIKRQSAPTHAAHRSAPQVMPASPQPHAPPAAAAPPAEGLDALAEAVASSSGLGRGSLRSAPAVGTAVATHAAPAAHAPAVSTPGPVSPQVDYARPPQQKKRPVLMIGGIAIGGAVLLALLGAMFFSTGTVVTTGPGPGPGPGPSGGGDPGAKGPPNGGEEIAIPTTPHFCGVSLDGEPSVVYVLDCGQATITMFDTLKEATYRSLETLKPGQQFAVIFWTKNGEEAMYPPDGLATARREEIEAARTHFVDVYAGSSADPHAAIAKAAALKPAAIVLVTGKAFELEDELVDFTLTARAGSPTKVHTFALGSDDNSTVLPRIAKSTGGTSRVVSHRELRHYSD